MADDSELDYLRTFVDEAILVATYVFSDIVASVSVPLSTLNLAEIGGALNQYAGHTVIVQTGDNVGEEYTVVSNTNETPTILKVSETIPADLATDTIKVYTMRVIVATYETVRKASNIAGLKKCLIEPGETLNADGAFYKKRFKLKVVASSEAIMTAIINEIIDGCIVYNRRGTGYTYPVTMCHVKFVYTNKTFKEGELWKNDVYLDVEWCTS